MTEPNKSDILIFEKYYHCWLNGKYIGEAKFSDDQNIGPSFLKMSISTNGELIHEVYMPDNYKLVC